MSAQLSSENLAREWVRSQQNIHAYIASLTYDSREAEDLLQETAARVFEYAGRYDVARPFLPWAFGIARNVVLRHRRNAARHRCVIDEGVMDQLAEEFDSLAGQRERLRDALGVCREKLPSRYRNVCRMRYEGGFSIGEIARRLDCTVGAARALLHRIRDQLRRCIDRQLDAEGAQP